MKNIQSVEELINNIEKTTDPNWSDLKKIRYAYLETCKCIKKEYMFFMTLYKKIDPSYKYTEEELKKIYEDQKQVHDKENWNKVICRSSSEILKRVLERLGIESKIVKVTSYGKTPEDTFNVHHFFLVANCNGHSLFLTPIADLANVQNNFPTEHFGNFIPYRDKETGEIQYYGEEIKDYIKVPTKDIIETDIELGYAYPSLEEDGKIEYVYSNKFFEKIRDRMVKNKWFYEAITEETEFFQATGINQDLSFQKKDIQLLKNTIKECCKVVGKELSEKKYDYEQFDYNTWLLHYKDTENKKLLSIYNSYVEKLNEICNNIEQDKYQEKEKLIIDKNRLIERARRISSFFISEKELKKEMIKNKFVSVDYISKKFELLFKDFLEEGTKTDFSKLDYNEQIAMINPLINIIFQDVSEQEVYDQSRKGDGKISPIFRIIHYYPVKMKDDGRMNLFFEIKNHESETPYYYKYDLKENRLERKKHFGEFLLEAKKNIVCSRSLLDKIYDQRTEKK